MVDIYGRSLIRQVDTSPGEISEEQIKHIVDKTFDDRLSLAEVDVNEVVIFQDRTRRLTSSNIAISEQGSIDMGKPTRKGVIGLKDPTDEYDAATKKYVDDEIKKKQQEQPDRKSDIAGGAMTGPLDMSSYAITNLRYPEAATYAATKSYVDRVIELPSSFRRRVANILGTFWGGSEKPDSVIDIPKIVSSEIQPFEKFRDRVINVLSTFWKKRCQTRWAIR